MRSTSDRAIRGAPSGVMAVRCDGRQLQGSCEKRRTTVRVEASDGWREPETRRRDVGNQGI